MKPIFPIGSIVYHVAGVEESSGGVVTGLVVRANAMTYLITWGDIREETSHMECELSVNRPVNYLNPNKED